MFGDKRILAVIPARGGSKRIPKKNIYPIAGKPMIAWTIQAAIKSNYIDTVLVSTDSDEIKDVAINHGAQVPFLRENNADDYAPVSQATLSALHQSEAVWGNFDVIIQLMPNCPLRDVSVIDGGIDQFFQEGRIAQISFFKFGWMNPWWAHTIDKELHPKPVFPQAIKSRSQDLQELYCPTGAVWVSNSYDLKNHGSFYAPEYKAYIIDWISALDIDDMNDIAMAEAAFQLKGI